MEHSAKGEHMKPKEALEEAQKICKEFGWDPENGGIVPQIALIIVLSKIVQEIQESPCMTCERLVRREE